MERAAGTLCEVGPIQEHAGVIDEHCRHAEASGAQIIRAPQDEFFGDRVYRAKDIEGHVWTFSQHVRDVSIAEMERVSGLKIEGDGR